MSFLARAVALHAGPQEVLAAADPDRDGPARRPDRAGQGLGGRAVHLHAVLTPRCAILGISAFYHDSAAALVRDGEIVAAAQEERFTRKKHDARFPRHALDYCLARGRASASTTSTSSRSTTSRSSSSSACSRPTSRSRRAASGRSAWRCRSGCSEKLFQKDLLRDELRELDAGVRLGRAPAVHRASPEPRRERVLPLAVRRGGGPHDGRRRRVGDDLARRSARGNRPRGAQGDPLPALARPALLRVHLLHRLQGQLGRVQGDGARALRRAALRAARSSTT